MQTLFKTTKKVVDSGCCWGKETIQSLPSLSHDVKRFASCFVDSNKTSRYRKADIEKNGWLTLLLYKIKILWQSKIYSRPRLVLLLVRHVTNIFDAVSQQVWSFVARIKMLLLEVLNLCFLFCFLRFMVWLLIEDPCKLKFIKNKHWQWWIFSLPSIYKSV